MTDATDKARVEKATRDGRRARTVVLRPMAPIVPQANVSGTALIVVIAIMSFLCCMTLGSVFMVQDTAKAWQGQISREITIQVMPQDGVDMETTLEAVRTSVLSFSGVSSARIIDRASTARLLEPWLGDDFNMDELPVPRLVVVTVDEGSPPDTSALREALAISAPQATLDDHRAWTGRLVAMARTTILVGVGILALMLSTTMLTVIFATRGAMAGNRHIIEVLHFVGAESGFIASQFQTRFLMIGLKGASVGGALAASVFLLLGVWQNASMATPLNDQATALFGRFQLGDGGYFGIVAVIALIAAMTTLTTRLTVIRTIEEIDRERANPSMAELE